MLFYTNFGQPSSHFGRNSAYFCILLHKFARLCIEDPKKRPKKKLAKKTIKTDQNGREIEQKGFKTTQNDPKKGPNSPLIFAPE